MSNEVQKNIEKLDKSARADISVKCTIFGPKGVGKSSLLAKGNFWNESKENNMFFSHYWINFKFQSNKYRFHFWEIHDVLKNQMTSGMVKGSCINIILFSFDDRDSFNNLKNYIAWAKANGNPGSKIVLVGNKSDVEKKAVSDDEVKNVMNSLGIELYFKTSSTTGEGVEELFENCFNIYYDNYYKETETVTGSLSAQDPEWEQVFKRNSCRECLCYN